MIDEAITDDVITPVLIHIRRHTAIDRLMIVEMDILCFRPVIKAEQEKNNTDGCLEAADKCVIHGQTLGRKRERTSP